MKKEIPYFKQPDDTHCFQACLKMVLKYFFPEKDFTFEELDRISDKPRDKATWFCSVGIELKKMNLKVRYYSTFDYSDFVKNGVAYIRKNYEKDVAEQLIEMSDIESEIENSQKMLEDDIFELKELSFEDIENWFKENYIMILLVNWGIINNKSEYLGHYVVLTGLDKTNVYIHDPDIENGSQNRKVNRNLFIKAWKFPEKENDIILIKK